MTIAAEKLRRLLDKRGVEWLDVKYEGITYGVKWRGVGGMYFLISDYDNGYDNGKVYLQGVYMTPEQAIAATLGRGTCEMYRDEHGTWHCKACESGADTCTGSDGTLDAWHDSWAPNFCPDCGCKVVDA